MLQTVPEDNQNQVELDHFAGKLINSDLKSHLKFVEDRPHKVVRVATPDPLEDETIGTVIRKHLQTIPYFTELQEAYGIAVPEIKLATGAVDHKNALLVETDMIYGDNLHHKTFTDEERPLARKELEHLCESLSHYLTAKYESGEPFLSDLVGLGQFVYGRKNGEVTDRVYLVDLHPRTAIFDKEHPGSTGNLQFVTNLQSQYHIISELEQRCGGAPFIKARAGLRSLIEKVPPDIPLPMLLSSARQGLGIPTHEMQPAAA